MTQATLAEHSRISRTSLVNVEKGSQGVSISTLYRLAGALSLAPGRLLPPLVEANEELNIAIGEDDDSARIAARQVLQRLDVTKS